MPSPVDATAHEPMRGILFDLLMAVMDSMEVWSAAAGDRRRGLAWRDGVTARMVAQASYAPYEDLVVEAARELGLPASVAMDLFDGWPEMSPWPDSSAIARLTVPYGFVTNCSKALAEIAARRSGLSPVFTLSAEEAGYFKPEARIYRQACRRLGSPPELTLHVAGSVYDAEGAHRAGLLAALVARRAEPLPGAEVLFATSLDEIVLELERQSLPSDR
jgi:2-haloacid dehalogenase